MRLKWCFLQVHFSDGVGARHLDAASIAVTEKDKDGRQFLEIVPADSRHTPVTILMDNVTEIRVERYAEGHTLSKIEDAVNFKKKGI